MTIFTIGYEGLNIDEFLSLLVGHGIETVVDIRELPLSRKPGFSKKSLANVLNLSGLEYAHIPNLGCPKPVRDKYRDDGNWPRYTEGFLKHLKSQKAAIAELSSLAGTSSCALLCFEADFNFCHRSMVANAVKNFSGMSVEHIQGSEIKTKSPDELQVAFA
jgi:uncharacterized protein (DUF488 family)